jgi:hypothetical protein
MENTVTQSTQAFVAQTLHSMVFLKEFSFARNLFSTPSKSELELADAVVMLGDVLLIYQIKERSAAEAGDVDAERRWFESKVRGKAIRQVKNTLQYLNAYKEISVPNERGHVFNLAAHEFRAIIKIVIFLPAANFPDDCQRVRHHVSGTAGFIHILDARDYYHLSRILKVPEEIVRYFEYRERVLTEFSRMCGGLPEPSIAGHFIGGDPDVPPAIESASYLGRLVDDEEEWNLTPLLRGLYDHITTNDPLEAHYKILVELAKLPRSMWREVKTRIRLCIEKVQRSEFAQPYRLAFPDRDCGFVFVPVDQELTQHPDWPNMKVRGLENFMRAHKHDQRLGKCVGVQVSNDGSYVEIYWGLIEFPWTEDPAMDAALKQNFPFRPVREGRVPGYMLFED